MAETVPVRRNATAEEIEIARDLCMSFAEVDDDAQAAEVDEPGCSPGVWVQAWVWVEEWRTIGGPRTLPSRDLTDDE